MKRTAESCTNLFRRTGMSGRRAGSGDVARALQRLHLPAHIHHLAGLIGRNNAFGEIGELRLKLLVGHRHLDAADGVLNVFEQ